MCRSLKNVDVTIDNSTQQLLIQKIHFDLSCDFIDDVRSYIKQASCTKLINSINNKMSRVTRSSKTKEHLELNDSYFFKQNTLNRRRTNKSKSKDESSQISQYQEPENLKQPQKLQQSQTFQQLQKFKEPISFKETESFKQPKYFKEPKKTYVKKNQTKQKGQIDYDAWKKFLNPTSQMTSETVQKKQIKPISKIEYQITIIGLNRQQYPSKSAIMEICPSIPYQKITMKANNSTTQQNQNSMKVYVRIKDQAHMLKFQNQVKILFPKLITYVRQKNPNEE